MRGWVVLVTGLLLAEPGVGLAEVKFSRTAVNLGEIRGGQPLAQIFSFVNDGDTEVEVLEVRPGCGCLSPRLSATRLAPGEKASLAFDLRTLGQAGGPHTWTAHVRYRRGEQLCEVPLRISAHIVNDILLQPSALNLVARGAMTQELILTDIRRRPLDVTGIHSSSPYLQARLGSRQKNAAGHLQTRIMLDLSASCPAGRYTETLAIHTNDAEYPQLIVPVSVTMTSSEPLSAQPNTLDLRVGESPVTRFVRISSALPEPIVIENVTANHPALSCSWARGPDNAATVRVRIDAAGIDDAVEAVLRVQVSGGSVEVPVRIRKD